MDPRLLYHITPISNLSRILEAGGLLPHNRLVAGAYTDVSHAHIQERRAHRQIPCGPRGTLHDYVPFFFCNRPPMLYSIHKKGRQRDMIYIVTSIEKVRENNHRFVFSDGHAAMRFSNFYDNETAIENIDWPLMKATYWTDTVDDTDRQRRRQAEFLIHDFVPVSSWLGIAVQSQRMETSVKKILAEFDLDVYINIKNDWYY
ncbi:MAG: DUF4433 domain-containing protein [Bacteroidota bacterium]